MFYCIFINKGKCPMSQKMPFFPKKALKMPGWQHWLELVNSDLFCFSSLPFALPFGGIPARGNGGKSPLATYFKKRGVEVYLITSIIVGRGPGGAMSHCRIFLDSPISVTLSNFPRQSYISHTGEFPIGHTGEEISAPSYWRKKIDGGGGGLLRYIRPGRVGLGKAGLGFGPDLAQRSWLYQSLYVVACMRGATRRAREKICHVTVGHPCAKLAILPFYLRR